MMWLLLGIVGFVSLVVVPVLINKSTENNLDWIKPRLREAWCLVGLIYSCYILSTDTVKLWFVSWRNGFGSRHPELSYLTLAAGAIAIAIGYWNFLGQLLLPEESTETAAEKEQLHKAKKHPETEENKLGTNWREKFANPQWEIIRDRRFENETVTVDGKSFIRCSFKNVKLLFHGTAPFEFQPGTEFDKGSIMFGTDDPAVALYDSIQTKIATIPGAKLALKDAKGHDIPLARVRVEPKITRVNHEFEDAAGNIAYPLKMRVQFRNDSPMSIGVAVSEYVRGEAPIQDPLPIGVLQVKLGDEWLPAVNGQQKIAVPPGQLFRIWIGFDRTRISRAQLEGMWGRRLGMLVLLADETPVEVPL
jgi:hypothetical protein